MFCIQNNLLKWWFLVQLLCVNLCFGDSETFDSFPVPVNAEQILRNEIFITKDMVEKNSTLLNPTIQLNSYNWTADNQKCLKELIEMVHGLNNFEEWAMKCMCKLIKLFPACFKCFSFSR